MKANNASALLPETMWAELIQAQDITQWMASTIKDKNELKDVSSPQR